MYGDSYRITEGKASCVCRKIISRKADLHTNFWLSRPKLIIGLCSQARPIKFITYYTGDPNHIRQSPVSETCVEKTITYMKIWIPDLNYFRTGLELFIKHHFRFPLIIGISSLYTCHSTEFKPLQFECYTHQKSHHLLLTSLMEGSKKVVGIAVLDLSDLTSWTDSFLMAILIHYVTNTFFRHIFRAPHFNSMVV